MAADLGASVRDLVGNEALLEKIDISRYATAEVGLPTLRDILDELRKPGRDPRAEFVPPAFRDDVTEPKDLKPGMVLEGVVTIIVAFGAFVDIGVHQDGLVHVSQLADRFVRDANEVVKVGQRVKVTVMSVDLERNRIALTMKKQPGATGAPATESEGARATRERQPKQPKQPTPQQPPRGFRPGDVAPNGIRFR
jgi:uncharacterized protein